MYELVQVSKKCYYINCPAKIGVYAADNDNVYLIDSGKLCSGTVCCCGGEIPIKHYTGVPTSIKLPSKS